MQIRKSTIDDLDALMPIFEEARGTIAKLGINQWQDGYPNRAVIEEDILAGRSYLVRTDAGICGTFALIDDGEPTYDQIFDGDWLTGDTQSYIAVHRVAVAVASRGTGISSAIIEYASETAKNLKRDAVRIDTHEGNVVMRRMLEKNGMTYCGVIYLQNGDPRVAYEKIVLQNVK